MHAITLPLAQLPKDLMALRSRDPMFDPSDSIKDIKIVSFTSGKGALVTHRELPLRATDRGIISHVFTVGGLGTVTLELNKQTGVLTGSVPQALQSYTLRLEVEVENLNRRSA